MENISKKELIEFTRRVWRLLLDVGKSDMEGGALLADVVTAHAGAIKKAFNGLGGNKEKETQKRFARAVLALKASQSAVTRADGLEVVVTSQSAVTGAN